jgi:predicted  nucleic acid-binding Zn-ribbon protein
MADSELVRAKRKLAALRRAEFRLEQRLEAIDFEIDVLQPEIKALEERAVNSELPEFMTLAEGE